ncbi:MAG TPA: response regulator [Bryobacteraceae bacterium]
MSLLGKWNSAGKTRAEAKLLTGECPEKKGFFPHYWRHVFFNPCEINQSSVECELQSGALGGSRLKTILIVDRDLGFVFWLGQILDAAGYVAVPAKGVADAAEIVVKLRLSVDILITPMAEHGLHEFVEKLRCSSPDLHVVALANEEDPAGATPPPGAVWKRKPQHRDEAAKSEWLGLIRGFGRNYLASGSHG